MVATGNGTTTTFIDALNISSATESPVGRVLLTSDGTQHRVTSWSDSTSTLTFTPAVASSSTTQSGATAELFNKRSQGFTPTDYKQAINAAINAAFPLGLIETVNTIGTAFDSTAPEVTVPASMVYVYLVEFEDEDSFWHVVPKATRTNEWGWVADPAAGQIRILGYPGYDIDGLTIRLTGYARQDELSNDSDTCLLNVDYVTEYAAEFLTLGALDKDQMYGQMEQVFLGRMKPLRTRLRTIKKPGSELVRSA